MYVKVNKRMSTYGPFKALVLADGTKVNVSEKSKFYNVFDESGDYELQIGTSQKGNPMVVAATKLGVAGANPAPTAVLKTTYTPAAKLAQNTLNAQNLDKKIDFEKEKQKDIMIQCYIGRAIDILTVNNHDKGFTVEDVTKVANELLIAHRSLAMTGDTKSGTEHAEDTVFTKSESDDLKREEDLERVPEEKPTVQEDIPF